MAPAKTGDTPKGKVLVNDKGMTLYVFDKDTAGRSACNGPCPESWPPLAASESDKSSGD
jgi:predicted lipoprotein with Yx(FWY)xxD motif